MEVVCTIITKNYGHFALALHDSLLEHNKNIHFYVFISNGELPNNIKAQLLSRKHVVLVNESFFKSELALKLRDKYRETYHDAYRWSMKPILLSTLLNQGFEKVIYVDSDIYFFNDYNFLFKELETCNVLLSPHWRCSIPELDQENFKLNFLDGIYNGGFVGVSEGGQEAMLYWAELCLYKCDVDRPNGYYVDQKYLDVLPSRFHGVKSIMHKGCNVANWNMIDCKRILKPNGQVLINGIYPIVFIHFTNSLFKGAYLSKKDTLLIPYIEAYRDNLLKYTTTDIIDSFFKRGINKKSRTENNYTTISKKNRIRDFLKSLVKYLKE